MKKFTHPLLNRLYCLPFFFFSRFYCEWKVLLIFFSFFYVYLPYSFLAGQEVSVYPQENFLIPGKTVTYLISNRYPSLNSIRAVVESCHTYEDGTQLFTPTQDLKVSPSHFFLRPQTNRKIEVSWKDHIKPSLSEELVYRVSFLQAPMDYKKSQYRAESVNMYVRSYTPEARLEMEKVEISRGVLSVHIYNTGSTHLSISDPTLSIFFRGKRQERVPKHSLIGKSSYSQLHANNRRILLFTIPKDWKKEEIEQISLEFHNSFQDQNILISKDL